MRSFGCAIVAAIAFIVALILHIAGGSVNKYVLDAELVGFIFIALSLASAVWWGWGRNPNAPV